MATEGEREPRPNTLGARAWVTHGTPWPYIYLKTAHPSRNSSGAGIYFQKTLQRFPSNKDATFVSKFQSCWKFFKNLHLSYKDARFFPKFHSLITFFKKIPRSPFLIRAKATLSWPRCLATSVAHFKAKSCYRGTCPPIYSRREIRPEIPPYISFLVGHVFSLVQPVGHS